MPEKTPTFSENDYLTLSTLLRQIFDEHPNGISEYDLLKHLQSQDDTVFNQLNLRSHLTLFQSHFLLFHILYRLRDQLLVDENLALDINPLKIILQAPSVSNANALVEADPLREYYLDLTHLFETSDDDVVNLIASFWSGLKSQEQREFALAELGLKDPVDYPDIKKQYRMLAMQHHPDRGGDTRRLQIINAAMEILEKGYTNRGRKVDTTE